MTASSWRASSNQKEARRESTRAHPGRCTPLTWRNAILESTPKRPRALARATVNPRAVIRERPSGPKKTHLRLLFFRAPAPARTGASGGAPRFLTLGADSVFGPPPAGLGISNPGFFRRVPEPGVRGPRSRKKILMGKPSQGSTSRILASRNRR